MSISRFQSFMQKGCGPAIMFFCALVFAFWAFASCGQVPRAGGGDQQAESKSVAVVAGTPITADQLQAATQAAIQQQTRGGQDLPPIAQAQIAATTLQQEVNGAAIMALAQKNGVVFSDQAIQSAIDQEVDQQIQMARLQMTFSKELKPNATEKDFEAAFQKKNGITLEQAKARLSQQIQGALKDKSQRSALIEHYAPTMLMEALKARINPTDEQLKHSFDTYTVKRIFISSTKGDAAQTAEKVEADLKAGDTFEKAIDRYSNDVPQAGKKLSESTSIVSAAQIDADPAFKALSGLKEGQVSPVMDVPGGKAIYKVVRIASTVPPDFDKNRARYRDQFAQSLASQEVRTQLDQLTSGNSVQWSSKGYQALYDLAKLQQGPTAPSNEAIRRVYDEAKAAAASAEGFDRTPAVYAEYAAFETLYNSPGADKKKMEDDRIAVLKDVLQVAESPTLHLELVKLYTDKKDGEDAFEQLMAAAQMNHDTGVTGQRTFGDIAAATQQLESAKLINAQQAKQIATEQDRWRSEKAEADKTQAEMKKQDEQLRKEQEAEAKKAGVTLPKAGPAPAAPGTGGR